MKKVISLILVLVMCLGLCACGINKNKFVGTYENKGFISSSIDGKGKIYTLVLNEDGTGYEKYVICELSSRVETDTRNQWKIGDIARESDITWTTDGEYVIIERSTKNYVDFLNDYKKIKDPKIEFSKESYTLEGGQLVWAGRPLGYYKIS